MNTHANKHTQQTHTTGWQLLPLRGWVRKTAGEGHHEAGRYAAARRRSHVRRLRAQAVEGNAARDCVVVIR